MQPACGGWRSGACGRSQRCMRERTQRQPRARSSGRLASKPQQSLVPPVLAAAPRLTQLLLSHATTQGHDGVSGGTAYYGGHGNWAPIMGVSRARLLGSDFSKVTFARPRACACSLALPCSPRLPCPHPAVQRRPPSDLTPAHSNPHSNPELKTTFKFSNPPGRLLQAHHAVQQGRVCQPQQHPG